LFFLRKVVPWLLEFTLLKPISVLAEKIKTMKKTLFTVCSILTVCTVIFLACTKSDDKYNNDGTHRQVTYSGQSTASSGGSGGNPNPNNNPSSSGITPTNTVVACTKSLTFDAAPCTGVVSNILGSTVSLSAGCSGAVSISFPGSGSPASGTYVIVTGPVGSGQCNFSNGGSFASGGSVTITTGSSNKAAFSGIVCGTHTLSGTACY
jgi:CDGSH-type Zn-finger protein